MKFCLMIQQNVSSLRFWIKIIVDPDARIALIRKGRGDFPGSSDGANSQAKPLHAVEPVCFARPA